MSSVIGSVHKYAVFGRRARVLCEKIEPLLPQGARVLDVGSGDGTIAATWMNDRPDLEVEGIDVFVRDATRVPVLAFDGRTIPYADKSWDVVSFVDVLHHSEDALQLLREAARVARQYVVVKDHFAENAVDHMTLRFMDYVGNAPHGVVRPYTFFSRAAWAEFLAKSGIEQQSVDERIPLYPFPFSLLFGRGLHFVARLRPA